MRVACLWLGLILILAAGCRPPLPPPDAGSGDDGGSPPDFTMVALPDCTKAPDCYACCAGSYQSGALDFDSSLNLCACGTTSPCAGACKTTVCGSGVGADATCLACIDGLATDGGACQANLEDCIETDGACGAFKSCAESCSGTGTP